MARTIRYLTAEEILLLHRRIVERTGGALGLRDRGALESAVAQPQMTFDGRELYANFPEKAGALCLSLAIGHPFVDGNKRVAHAAVELFLVLNDRELSCSVDEQERVMLALAAGTLKREQLAEWLTARIRPFGTMRD
ncbi:MAG: type II toxin-antitoxin system death-on-curing family toxin [Geitlerinemataceae cyanobacterium]